MPKRLLISVTSIVAFLASCNPTWKQRASERDAIDGSTNDASCPASIFTSVTCMSSQLGNSCPGSTSCQCSDGRTVEAATSCVCEDASLGRSWRCADDCATACAESEPVVSALQQAIDDLCTRLVAGQEGCAASARRCPAPRNFDQCVEAFAAYACEEELKVVLQCAATRPVMCADLGEYDPVYEGCWYAAEDSECWVDYPFTDECLQF